MLKEVSDHFEILTMVHRGFDGMVGDLPDDVWVKKPFDGFNNIASIIEHVTLVERRFMAGIAGTSATIDAFATFSASEWNVPRIRREWADSLESVKAVFETVTVEMLDEFGAKIGVGELNKRQLIVFASCHATHHRGQLPLIKRLLETVG